MFFLFLTDIWKGPVEIFKIEPSSKRTLKLSQQKLKLEKKKAVA